MLFRSDYDTLTIVVSVEPSKIESPNVFTPNGDGINDVYKFSKESLKGMKEFHLTIYNRWGEKMYETKSQEDAINIGWDGKNTLGITASPGIYYYVIYAKGKDGIIYKGDRGSKKNKKPDENTVTTASKGTIHLFR